MSEDLGLEAEFADGFAVAARLLGRSGARKFDVWSKSGQHMQLVRLNAAWRHTVYTKLVQCLGYLDFGVQVEVGAGALLANAQ